MSVAAPSRYIVVCRGPNCREHGGLQLRKRLVQLMKDEKQAHLVGYACFGQCDFGPNVVFYPEGEWRGGLSAADAERIIVHATRGEPPPGSSLMPPQAEQTLHEANIAALVTTVERDRAKRARGRWWWPF